MLSFVRLLFAILLTVATVVTINILSGRSVAAIDPYTATTVLAALLIAVFVSPRLHGFGDALNIKREKGQVKWFNVSKGYGFITRESGDDVFVHFRGIRGRGRRNLQEGQTVNFILTQGEKGPQADDVVVEGEEKES